LDEDNEKFYIKSLQRMGRKTVVFRGSACSSPLSCGLHKKGYLIMKKKKEGGTFPVTAISKLIATFVGLQSVR